MTGSDINKTGVAGQDAPASAGKRPPRKRGRGGLWLLFSLVFLVAVAGFGVMGLTGKTLRLPVWAVAEAEARMNAAFAGGGDTTLSLGGVAVTVGRDWVPRLRLDDLRLAKAKGGAILTLPEVRLIFDPVSLLEGKLRPRSLSLVGARIMLGRDRDGVFDLRLGGDMVTAGPDSFAAVLDAVDAAFALPVLSQLQRIEAEALTLTLQDARAGRTWQVGDGRLTLENRADELAMEMGLSLVAGGKSPAQAVVTLITRKGSAEARITATVDHVAAADLAAIAPPIAWLGVLDAPISGQLSTGIDSAGRVATLDGVLTIAGGALRPTVDTPPIPFDNAALTLRYDSASEKITLSEVKVESATLQLSASGQVYLPGVATGLPDSFLAQINFSDATVNPEGMFARPVRFSGGALDLRLRLDPFTIDIGQLSLVEEGRRLQARGRIAAGPKGWNVALDLGLNAITHSQLLVLWPVSVVVNTRNWLAENVQEGLLYDVKVALRLVPGQAPRLSLGYEFADADVRFLKTLPPIRNGNGYATIEGNTYTMVMDSGHVTPALGGDIDMTGSVFSVLDITQVPAQAEIRLKTDSSLTAALSLLDEPPFGFLTKAGRPVELGEGHARLEALMRLPLVKKVLVSDVRFEVDGQITNLRSEVLVPGRVLTAPALTLTATPAALQISGPGKLGAVPFEATYTQSLGPEDDGKPSGARIEGMAELSPLTIREFGLGLPDGMVSGLGTARIEVDLQKGTDPALRLTSDLRGLRLTLPEIGWTKPQTQTGKLLVEARLGRVAVVDRLDLEGAGLKARGTVALREGGGLEVARFSKVTLGGWLDAGVDLTGRGAGQPVGITLTGGTLDLRRMGPGIGGGSSNGKQGAGSPIKAQLNELRVSDGIALTGFRGDFAQNGGFNGSFTAQVNGRARVSGTVVPTSKGSAVRIRSDDAGGVLAAAGIFESARGGALELQLLPTGTEGHYDGKARATDLRVRDAPVLASLLNAISVVGILDQLNGTGLVFNEARTSFRLTPTAIEITKGSAVGASMGVSMAGLYQSESKKLDMQGVISPIYLINGIGSVLTRRGEGLFGFNYRVRGTSDAPQVSVNPLSILTPGMFRDLFRRSPPGLEDAG
ncbi:MAG: DUF3971 domain-containing protein [Paracoccaceae bacterium]|nr:DUF3971 domain-containing protein [Paracoccaceae bacterium]